MSYNSINYINKEMLLPDTRNSLFFKTGDCIRLPLPVHIDRLPYTSIPTRLFKLKNRLTASWVEI